MGKVNIFWFRRDLRLHDNTGLSQALQSAHPVVPIFIFDRQILDQLEDRDDRRVNFIHKTILSLQARLVQFNTTLDVRYGDPLSVFKELQQQYDVHAVFTNHDYEPYAINRDHAVSTWLQQNKIEFHSYKDQVVFEKNEVVKDNGEPYAVYTPYSRKWLSLLKDEDLTEQQTEKYFHHFFQQEQKPVPSLEEIGFTDQDFQHQACLDFDRIHAYHLTRDIPSLEGTTRAGVDLRFGTVSIRQLVKDAMQWNKTFLGELIWREFFMQVLWHEPEVVHRCFKKEYEAIRWRNQEDEFEKWCQGQTGYPLVDAGMRELNTTGFMHNRVRMVAASFLVKDLLIDWRWGEAYFAGKLLDYELASNNGNWQWVAGCGCDAAPYFRIFNPNEQAKKFDPQANYIKKWIPELEILTYPPPMIDHKLARERCLTIYKQALKDSKKCFSFPSRS